MTHDKLVHRCGGGTQVAEPGCVEANNGRVSNSFCHATERPTTLSRVCNRRPCTVRWKTSGWSVCKSLLGRQTRNVRCLREAPRVGEADTELPSKACKLPTPKSWRFCRGPGKKAAKHARVERFLRRHGTRDFSLPPRSQRRETSSRCKEEMHRKRSRSLDDTNPPLSEDSTRLKHDSHKDKHVKKHN